MVFVLERKKFGISQAFGGICPLGSMRTRVTTPTSFVLPLEYALLEKLERRKYHFSTNNLMYLPLT
jgi:hypothetical protein